MTAETTIEKAKSVIEEMRELLAKLEAERAAPRRNWPEKIEAGMRKEDAKNGDLFRSYGRIVLIPPSYPNTYAIALTGESVGCQCYGWGDDPKLEYLGKLDLTRIDELAECNAALIAALPDLLAIAQGQREELARLRKELDEANECRDPAYFAQVGRCKRR